MTLLKEIWNEIFLFRAHLSLKRKLNEFGIKIEDFDVFLKLINARLFGSVIISCLLDNDNFDDFDIAYKIDHQFPALKVQTKHNFKNKEFWTFESQRIIVLKKCLFENNHVKILEVQKEPHDYCGECNTEIQCPSVFDTRLEIKIETTNSKILHFDFIGTKDISCHIKYRCFDIEQIYYENGRFHFPQGFNLVSFCTFPTFKIESIENGLEFEKIYDFTPQKCDYTNHKSKDYEVRRLDFIFTKYRSLFESNFTFPKWFPIFKIKNWLKSNPKVLSPESCKDLKHKEIENLLISKFNLNLDLFNSCKSIHRELYNERSKHIWFLKMARNIEDPNIAVLKNLDDSISDQTMEEIVLDYLEDLPSGYKLFQGRKLEFNKSKPNYCKKDLNLEYLQVLKEIGSYIQAKEKTSDYRKVKSFFRICKLFQKGILCINLKQYILDST